MTKPAAGEHSQRMTSATSAGSAMWRSGLYATPAARITSVTQPVSVIGGWTTFAVMP